MHDVAMDDRTYEKDGYIPHMAAVVRGTTMTTGAPAAAQRMAAILNPSRGKVARREEPGISPRRVPHPANQAGYEEQHCEHDSPQPFKREVTALRCIRLNLFSCEYCY